MAGVRPPKVSIVYLWLVDPTSPESKSKVLLKLCMKLLTTRCALKAVSLTPRVDLEQGSGTYGSRARFGSFDDGIWLA